MPQSWVSKLLNSQKRDPADEAVRARPSLGSVRPRTLRPLASEMRIIVIADRLDGTAWVEHVNRDMRSSLIDVVELDDFLKDVRIPRIRRRLHHRIDRPAIRLQLVVQLPHVREKTRGHLPFRGRRQLHRRLGSVRLLLLLLGRLLLSNYVSLLFSICVKFLSMFVSVC